MSDNLLEIEGLRVHFDTLDGPIEALHSVDLKVEQGQIMGLVGESGCGKSVTSLVTIGLATCDVDEGSVKYEGEEMLFSVSEHDKKIQDVSGRITVLGVLASIVAVFWTILINPIQGINLLLIFLSVAIVSWIFGFIAKSEYRRHQKFMQSVRGNKISMIFQEPMTALNPLYTVEKQLSEVMRVHDRLVEAETPRYVRVGQALVSPATLIRDAFSSRPQASIATSSVLAFVLVAHLSGFADSAAEAVTAPFVFVFKDLFWVLIVLLSGYLVNSRAQIEALNALYRPLKYAAPQVPLVSAVALVIFLMLWMPLSALLGGFEGANQVSVGGEQALDALGGIALGQRGFALGQVDAQRGFLGERGIGLVERLAGAAECALRLSVLSQDESDASRVGLGLGREEFLLLAAGLLGTGPIPGERPRKIARPHLGVALRVEVRGAIGGWRFVRGDRRGGRLVAGRTSWRRG